MPTSATFTDRIKRKARDIGFDAVGVARVQEYPHADALREWLRQGMHAEMAYIPRREAERLDPTKVVPGARTIVSVAKLYRTREIPTDARDDPTRGVISRYAWGDDYHDVMGAELKALRAWIEDASDEPFESRVYVDSGPVLEREVAMLAGLGWIGKNTMLMSRELGSYFFLGEIITTLDLDPDAPVTDHCGSCVKCLDACPTDAFPEPYVLDARKCLSYLTIELKGAIPEGHRDGVGDQVFGCDICQEVCPWNQHHAQSSADPAVQPREWILNSTANEMASWSDDTWSERLRASALRRIKPWMWRRNLADLG